MSLPLPTPAVQPSELIPGAGGALGALYTADQLKAYGQACREQALEEALKERDIAVRKLAALSNAHALEDLYLVGLVQEREITLLTKEHDVLTVANRDLQDWFDALKTDHDALKDAARLALYALYAYEPCIKKFGLLFGTGNKAIAALKAVL